MDYFAGERPGRSTRPIALVIALLLIAGLIGALTVRPSSASKTAGSIDGDSATVLRTAASAASSTPMQLDAIITLHGARTVSYHVVGQMDGARRVSQTTVDPDAALFTEPIQTLGIGTDAYIRVPESRRGLTQNKPWARIDASAFQSSGLGSGDDAIQRLATLETDGTTAHEVGHETINGVATAKYELSIDPLKVSAALPSGFRPPMSGELTHLPPATVDIWVDAARRPRRIIQQFSFGGLSLTAMFNYYPLPAPLVLDRPADADTMTLNDPGPQMKAILPPLRPSLTSG